METPKKTYSKQGGRPKVSIGRIRKYVVSTRLSPERKLRFSALCREAGRKATADLIRLCPRSEVIDQSSFYSGHKDVNDYLTARIKDRTQKPSTQKNAPKTKAVQALRNNLQALKAETEEIEPPRRKGVKI